eukprot:RCo030452
MRPQKALRTLPANLPLPHVNEVMAGLPPHPPWHGHSSAHPAHHPVVHSAEKFVLAVEIQSLGVLQGGGLGPVQDGDGHHPVRSKVSPALADSGEEILHQPLKEGGMVVRLACGIGVSLRAVRRRRDQSQVVQHSFGERSILEAVNNEGIPRGVPSAKGVDDLLVALPEVWVAVHPDVSLNSGLCNCRQQAVSPPRCRVQHPSRPPEQLEQGPVHRGLALPRLLHHCVQALAEHGRGKTRGGGILDHPGKPPGVEVSPRPVIHRAEPFAVPHAADPRLLKKVVRKDVDFRVGLHHSRLSLLNQAVLTPKPDGKHIEKLPGGVNDIDHPKGLPPPDSALIGLQRTELVLQRVPLRVHEILLEGKAQLVSADQGGQLGRQGLSSPQCSQLRKRSRRNLQQSLHNVDAKHIDARNSGGIQARWDARGTLRLGKGLLYNFFNPDFYTAAF